MRGVTTPSASRVWRCSPAGCGNALLKTLRRMSHGRGCRRGIRSVDAGIVAQRGAAGAAILPGRSGDSLLVKMLRHERKPAMPQDADPLPKDLVDRIARWIDLGAPYDAPLVKPSEGPRSGRGGPYRRKRNRTGLINRCGPMPFPRRWPWNLVPSDRSIFGRGATRRRSEVKPGGCAGDVVPAPVVRPAGFAPAPEAIAAFEADRSPEAVAAAVDRMLASPHYGERWARHWLDLARFAGEPRLSSTITTVRAPTTSGFRHRGVQSRHAV